MDERRVLVVEDDAKQARLAQDSLEGHGFAVTVVGDGVTAFDVLSRESFAVILLDHGLARMNGLEVLIAIRARGVKAPIVMITAPGDECLAAEAMDAGATDFIVKTTGYGSAIPSVVRRVLAQQELLTENERLHRLTERRLREADALVELAGSLTSTLELKSLLDNICQAVARACEMDRCAIFSCDGSRVRLLAAQFADGRRDHGLSDEFADEAGRGLDELPVIAATIRGREPVVINDDALVAEHPDGAEPRCLLTLPLLSRDVVGGALLLDRKIGAEPLGASQVVLATAIASHVALALENARLYEQAQQAVTDLKDAQERMVRGETLRTLGELAGGASHHLNNLLAVISGRAQLLLRTGGLGASQRHVEIIERMTRQAADVVRRIQSFAGARRVGEPQRVDLNQVVEDVVEMTRARWHGALALGVTIDVQCELPPIPPVWGHVVALREVVTNLVLNAADALPRGGRIVIRTAATDGDVTLSVIDDGIGMAPDVLRRAQEPFFTTKGVKSTGLGLSVNYGIVKQHGGQVTIVSAVGKGTTVIVRLPAADVVAVPPITPVAVKSLRVLLVDDEAEVRNALGELLECAGHVVAGAANGAEAIARLEAGPVPDVLLTDHGMPGMTGAELTDIVNRRWPDLPVGLITGWGDEPQSVGEARPDFILSKPVHVERLIDTIGRTLAHRIDARVRA